jgi:hypothetical protein
MIYLVSGLTCFPQRAALLKSMLNFLKKAIPDPAFSESIRHCEYYPSSLLAICNNRFYMDFNDGMNKHMSELNVDNFKLRNPNDAVKIDMDRG